MSGEKKKNVGVTTNVSTMSECLANHVSNFYVPTLRNDLRLAILVNPAFLAGPARCTQQRTRLDRCGGSEHTVPIGSGRGCYQLIFV